MTGIANGVTAFRESYMNADTLNEVPFGDIYARRARYAIYWAFYENTAYRDVHAWARAYRAEYGLYRYIRNIYNPSYRIGEFWRAHLLGGKLDTEAGDGQDKPSALPITTDNKPLRAAIAQLWKWSNWQINKDILSLHGSIMGDSFIKINDDPAKGKVHMSVVHPGDIVSLELDTWGNIKGYTLEEMRPDPNSTSIQPRAVVYREVCERDGDNVVYSTFLDNRPYAEDGESYTWSEPYGFVPMVAVQHNNVGMGWGWSEIHSATPKLREVDDLVSKLDDQIRKAVDPVWFFSGVKKGDNDPVTGRPPTTDQTNREAGRDKVPAMYASDPNAKANALVATLDIQGASDHIYKILAEIEKDFPEISLDLKNAKADTSGRALRVHRQPVEDRVLLRRPSYYDPIVRAQQMAVAIGGFRGYEGFQGFNLDSYKKGNLDHSIGDRPVFSNDPMDDIEVEQAFWTAAGAAKTAGMPLPVFLERNGWSEDQIKKVVESPDYQAKLAALEAAKQISTATSANPDAALLANNRQPPQGKPGENPGGKLPESGGKIPENSQGK